jgi:hypothetical protein
MAHAICDRCGFRYNHVNLRWQFDYRGAGLQNLRILVCNRCEDEPQEQLRSIVLPPDPIPVMNARVQDFVDAESDYMGLSGSTPDPTTGIPVPNTTVMDTMLGANMTRQPVGPPRGYTQNAQMPLVNLAFYGVSLPVVSMISNGTVVVTVTTATPHGLSTNNQVSIEGALVNSADGAYSITVTTATAFTYQVGVTISAQSLLGSTTLVQTMNAGIPRNYTQIPATGN